MHCSYPLSIVCLLLEAHKTIFVFWSSCGLNTPVSADSEPSIISMSERRSLNCRDKYIILIISLPEKFKHFRVFVVADGLENHVVSLLEGNVPDVFHGLNERNGLSVSFLGLFLKMLGQRVLVVDVVTGPEVHAKHPCQEELWKATIDEGTIVKDSGSSLLVEMTVLEHWGVSVKVLDSGSSVLRSR